MKKWTEIEGWFNSSEVHILQKLCKNKFCLEIGSYKGKSTAAIAEVADKVYAVDTFSADGSGQNQMSELVTYKEFVDNLMGYNNVTSFIGKSSIVVPEFKDEMFDVIFIDAMHDFTSVKTDIEVSWPKLKMNGIMAFHDYGWDGVKDGGTKKAIHTYFDKVVGPFFSLVYVEKKRNKL